MILEVVLLVGLTVGQTSGGVAPSVLPEEEILSELCRLVSAVENQRHRQVLEGVLIEALVRAEQLEDAKKRLEWLREEDLVRRTARARGALALAVGYHHAGMESERDAHLEETLTFLEPRLVHRAVLEIARMGELDAAWKAVESISADFLRRDALSSLVTGAVLGGVGPDAIRKARTSVESEVDGQEIIRQMISVLPFQAGRWPGCSWTNLSLARESEKFLSEITGSTKRNALSDLTKRYRELGSTEDVRRLLREFECGPVSRFNGTAWLARVSGIPEDLAAAEAALATLDIASEPGFGWGVESGLTDLAVAWLDQLGPEKASLRVQAYVAKTALPENFAQQLVPALYFIVGDYARGWEMIKAAPVPAGRDEARYRDMRLGLVLDATLSLDHEIRGGCEFFQHPLMRTVCLALVARDNPSQLRVIPNDAESAVSYLLRIAALNQDSARFLAAGYELRDHLQGRNVQGPESYELLVVSALQGWRVDREFRKRLAWFLFKSEPNPASRVRFGLFLLKLED